MSNHPYYRHFPFKTPLFMISWNAVLACDTFERLVELPGESETLRDVRYQHTKRMLADGIDNSVLDSFSARVPYFCYLGYALADHAIMPLGGRFKLRWYPVDHVATLWNQRPEDSEQTLAKTTAAIERKYGVTLNRPTKASLP